MKFYVPPEKNDGKMLAVVKLIIANCNFSSTQEKSRRLCRKQDCWISFPNSSMCHQFNVKHCKYVFRIWPKIIMTSKKPIVSATTNWAN